MNRMIRRCLAALLCLACLALTGCRARQRGEATAVLVDGQPWQASPAAGEDGLRVIVSLDGAPLAQLPFGEAHTVTVTQPDGAQNILRLTGNAVYMAEANCENQDCVHMGEVTRENLETRVMGGFIICLPHKISVEVRGE